MNQLAHLCKLVKKDFSPKLRDPTKPVRCWSEKDILNNEIVDTFVIILATRGCSWATTSGCSMCGYFNDSLWKKVPDKYLLQQFHNAMEKYSGEQYVKIFNSGSFFDSAELSDTVRNDILNDLVDKIDKLSVESRPEYITDETVSSIKDMFHNKILEIPLQYATIYGHLNIIH